MYRHCLAVSVLLILAIAMPVSAQEQKPLRLVIVLDRSGSMVQTDPEDLASLAAEALISLLQPGDRVSVVEFSSRARVTCTWAEPHTRNLLEKCLPRPQKTGDTDYYLALNQALELFASEPGNTQNVIVFLTDGLLDPSQHTYSGISTYELSDHVESLIRLEQIPKLKVGSIQVFSVGLGLGSASTLLRDISTATSERPEESHYFIVENPAALLQSFIALMSYMRDVDIVEAQISDMSKTPHIVYVDDLFSNPRFLFLTSKAPRQLSALSPAGEKVEAARGRHQCLSVLSGGGSDTTGRWSFDFGGSSGPFSFLVVGKSELQVVVSDLEQQYGQSEEIRVGLSLEAHGRSVCSDLGSNSTIAVVLDGGQPTPLTRQQPCFAWAIHAPPVGTHTVKFIASAVSKDNSKPLLKRVTKEYRFEVIEASISLKTAMADWRKTAPTIVSRILDAGGRLPKQDHGSPKRKSDVGRMRSSRLGLNQKALAASLVSPRIIRVSLNGVPEFCLPPCFIDPLVVIEPADGRAIMFKSGESPELSLTDNGDFSQEAPLQRAGAVWASRQVELRKSGVYRFSVKLPEADSGDHRLGYENSSVTIEVAPPPPGELVVDGIRTNYALEQTLTVYIRGRSAVTGKPLDLTSLEARLTCGDVEEQLALVPATSGYRAQASLMTESDCTLALLANARDPETQLDVPWTTPLPLVFQFKVGEGLGTSGGSSALELLLLILKIVLALAGILAILYFLYIYGYLGEPTGRLLLIKTPSNYSGPRSFELANLKPDWWSRWLSPSRHTIEISNRSGAEIRATTLPDGYRCELSFFRLGGTPGSSDGKVRGMVSASVHVPGEAPAKAKRSDAVRQAELERQEILKRMEELERSSTARPTSTPQSESPVIHPKETAVIQAGIFKAGDSFVYRNLNLSNHTESGKEPKIIVGDYVFEFRHR